MNKNMEEHRFSNQAWKRVLHQIVEYAPNRYGRGKSNYGSDHPLVQRLKIKPHELMLTMSFLEEQGLIEYDKQDLNWISVTSKGFDIDTQNQSADKASRFYKGALFLSLAISISAISQLLLGIDDVFQKWFITLVFITALVIGGLFINRNF